jgi:hypothetical protein
MQKPDESSAVLERQGLRFKKGGHTDFRSSFLWPASSVLALVVSTQVHPIKKGQEIEFEVQKVVRAFAFQAHNLERWSTLFAFN